MWYDNFAQARTDRRRCNLINRDSKGLIDRDNRVAETSLEKEIYTHARARDSRRSHKARIFAQLRLQRAQNWQIVVFNGNISQADVTDRVVDSHLSLMINYVTHLNLSVLRGSVLRLRDDIRYCRGARNTSEIIAAIHIQLTDCRCFGWFTIELTRVTLYNIVNN